MTPEQISLKIEIPSFAAHVYQYVLLFITNFEKPVPWSFLPHTRITVYVVYSALFLTMVGLF